MIYKTDCLNFLESCGRYDTIFVDPPDNIGLEYDGFDDKIICYGAWFSELLGLSTRVAPYVWVSFNAKHLPLVGSICHNYGWKVKPCVQTFTFGQHNNRDLGNGYRPLWRIGNGPLYPETIREQSQRQRSGDKRANPNGRIPSDVFNFPRVTGNSKQRRKWHPTQLHEGLVERCLKLTTPPNGRVLDPCAGTGTTLRVCKRLGFQCDLVEISKPYYDKLVEEHPDQWT